MLRTYWQGNRSNQVQVDSWRIRATFVWFNFLSIKTPARKELIKLPIQQKARKRLQTIPSGPETLVEHLKSSGLHLFFIRDGIKASIFLLQARRYV